MIENYGAVVFDLDGTLVRLNVDWGTVAEEVAAMLRSRGVDPPDSLWGMLETADEHGHGAALEEIISTHEREGAATSTRLPAADTIPDRPTGVCSLNCEAACRIALSTHDIDGVDVIVGRDSVATEKPDPRPLLETVERLESEPAMTVFIGDTDRDATTAERAGIDYVDVTAWLRAYR